MRGIKLQDRIASQRAKGEGRKIRRARNIVKHLEDKLANPALSAAKREIVLARYRRMNARLVHDVLVGGP